MFGLDCDQAGGHGRAKYLGSDQTGTIDLIRLCFINKCILYM